MNAQVVVGRVDYLNVRFIILLGHVSVSLIETRADVTAQDAAV